MLSNVYSMSLIGMNGQLVKVQVDISAGMPSWEIVGLPDTTVRESKERIRTALSNIGINIGSKKIVVNLAPAYTKKEGSSFDLPIAIGVLSSLEIINSTELNQYIFIGELSLDGNVSKVNGVLAMCIAAKNLGFKKIVVPYKNKNEAGIIDDVEIYPVTHLEEVINHINGVKLIEQFVSDTSDFFANNCEYNIDFYDVKGQENAKRALEIAAAGAHNCILIGSPGTGKTMLSHRLPTILPDLTFNEALAITNIHSVAGKLLHDESLITKRPFRAPHYTTSAVAIAGGGSNPKPGEISLAHYGVLFLDELPEFNRRALESLRSPLEDKVVTITRANCTVTYPCDFMLVASMNPCPCGYANDTNKKCTCTPQQVDKYKKRISGPILDRIDIHVEVPNVEYKNLEEETSGDSSAQIRERVNKARKIQYERYKKYNVLTNSNLSTSMIREFCQLTKDSKKILEKAFEKFGFSARAYNRILKVARTIADLDESENIYDNHLMEAIQYRTLDRGDK